VSAEASWKSVALELPAGDALLLYTDGVTEARDPASGAEFGEAGLLQVLQAWDGAEAEALQRQLLLAVEACVRGSDQQDDITVMIVLRQDRSLPAAGLR
jgi:sigma-B regulation protein RsbU (phosphoserine phosphatase)